jgi:hypothetical protein
VVLNRLGSVERGGLGTGGDRLRLGGRQPLSGLLVVDQQLVTAPEPPSAVSLEGLLLGIFVMRLRDGLRLCSGLLFRDGPRLSGFGGRDGRLGRLGLNRDRLGRRLGLGVRLWL